MEKRGHKGTTRFYRAAPAIRSLSYNVAGGRRIVDILSGNQTRQTVAPPSLHPKGMRYRWTLGPVPASALPEFTAADLEKLEDTLKHLGWAGRDAEQTAAREEAIARIESGASNFFDEVKTAALANLGAWIPALDLYKLRKARGGFEAVATWRASSTGQPLEHRKRNLSMQRNGIKDFGADQTYTPIDLCIAAKGWTAEGAAHWLAERLGLVEGVDVSGLVAQSQRTDTAAPAEPESEGERPRLPWMDEEDGFGAFADPLAMELPEELTQNLPGFMGELVEYITRSARRPQRGLALGAALSILSAAAGQLYGGPTNIGLQLYLIGLARTGAGKDHPLTFVDKMLSAAGIPERVGAAPKSWNAVFKTLQAQPAYVVPLDEMGEFLKRVNGSKASNHESGISGALRSLWSMKFSNFRPPVGVGEISEPIYAPRLSIYGVSTPGEFYDAVTGADVTNGLLNRFLLISTLQRPADRDPEISVSDVPISAMERLASIARKTEAALIQASTQSRNADPILMQDAATHRVGWTSEAEAIWKDLTRRCEDRFDLPGGEFFGRTGEQAQRIAALAAIGVDHEKPCIDAPTMEWAAKLAFWSAERMASEAKARMSENAEQAAHKRVRALILEAGRDGIRHSDLLKRVGGVLNSTQLKAHLQTMLESETISARKLEKAKGERGPAGVIYTVTKAGVKEWR
jgi:hypothetical protein